MLHIIKNLRQSGIKSNTLDNDRIRMELVNDICLLAIAGWTINNVLLNVPKGQYLESFIAVPQLLFFILPLYVNRTSKTKMSVYVLLIPACITTSILYSIAGDQGYYELIFLFIFIGIFYLVDNVKWKWILWIFSFVLWFIPYQFSQKSSSIFNSGELEGLSQILFVVSAIGIYLVSEKVVNQISGYTHRYNTKIMQQKKNLMLLKAKNTELETKRNELKVKNGEIEIFFNLSSAYLKKPTKELIRLSEKLEKYKTIETTPGSKDYFSIINQSATRMNELIEAVFQYSIISRESPKQMVNSEQVIDEILIDLNVDIEKTETQVIWTSLPEICGNKVELRMLFQNLIVNAIKYCDHNRKPIINISAEDHSPIHWLFKFKDNGLGIPRNHQSIIFKMFQKLDNSNKIPGTGIGLANCKKIVNNHKGTIWVESELGKGSTFLFTIKKSQS